MSRVVIIFALIFGVFWGCKSSKSVYVSPHTDTIKVTTTYTPDTLELYVKKIIVSDSLFNIKETGPDFTVIDARQEDSLLFLTIKTFNGCTKMDFDLYQSSFVFKSYPPRLRMRLAKKKEGNCDDDALSKVHLFTEVFDIKGILADYKQVSITFSNSRAFVTLKQ